MFETGSEERSVRVASSGLWEFLLQTALVYPIIFLILRPVLAIGRDPKTWANPQSNFADIGVVLIGGAGLGLAAGSKWPRLARTARWVWILPSVFFVGGVITQMLHPPPIAAGPSEYFYSTTDNEGLGVFLITLPTFCLIGYALGLWLGAKLRPARGEAVAPRSGDAGER